MNTLLYIGLGFMVVGFLGFILSIIISDDTSLCM